ncbi:MAG: type I DNA topoisomerase [Fimbriimonadaceae bacterium]|jgi:DNA topoisomerase-1|nr:type I DNA topoisomerase [Fimbriimonadaceae bacterium]
MAKTLVIVESPNKARTISRILGDRYNVQASYGHVRDLPESSVDIPAELKGQKWSKLGVNVDEEFQPLYIVPGSKRKQVSSLKAALKEADTLLLATDEDREGESISWHLLEVLKPKKTTTVQRIVFHEVTPEALSRAIQNPRNLDDSLVKAQETRRILDRLYGYTLSPLLWKKVGPKLSAGRVQSVAVRLVVMRERERRDFVIASYASVSAKLKAAKGDFEAKLLKIQGSKVADGQSFNSNGELVSAKDTWLKTDQAEALAPRLQKARPWTVTKLETKPSSQSAPVPFMTSTLLQEANRKFGFTGPRTMQIAQALYEGIDIGKGAVGLITYMRTDSLSLAERALTQARKVIGEKYGTDYVLPKPRTFKSKVKNAQEAHEAIRPVDLEIEPQSIRRYLTDEQFKLYDLIWKRTLACQMPDAKLERTRVEIDVEEQGQVHTFLSTGQRIIFPGFLRVYVEGKDDPEAELGDRDRLLPALKEGETVEPLGVSAESHKTKPPARYTEASLTDKLEEQGVGRPSTYSTITGTIADRGYVFKRAKELVPTWTAFAVIDLLEQHFSNLVDIEFTARMETELDDIANGSRQSVKHLQRFYHGTDHEPGLVVEVETKGKDIPYPDLKIGEDISVRIGRNGPFLQRGEGGPGNTASIPEDLPPADLTLEVAKELLEKKALGPEAIGVDPKSGQCVFFKSGRYGDYLEIKQTETEISQNLTPRRVTIPPGVHAPSLTEEELALLLAFPRTIGLHPETNDPVVVAVGRYGAYLTHGEEKANVGEWRKGAEMTLEEAISVLKEPKRGGRGPSTPTAPLREFPAHEETAGPIKLLSGRYGPYVTDGETNASLPKGKAPESLTIEEAVALIKNRRALGPPAKKKKSTRSQTGAAKKTTSGAKTSKTKQSTTRKSSVKKSSRKTKS